MKIEQLEIKTRNLKSQQDFYSNTLGLYTYSQSNYSFEVKIGSSALKFIDDTTATPYHIAFHIPSAQEEASLKWIKQRVQIQKNGQEEIVNFSAWNARSLYFYDTDKNILEFISRKDLYPPATKIFTEKSILSIAEIGLATNNISEKFKVLNETCGLKKFDGNFENFCATGDDEGLIIIIDKNKKEWFPTNDKAYSSNFKMTIKQEEKRYELIFEKDCLSITS